jgi:hypothetical protein
MKRQPKLVAFFLMGSADLVPDPLPAQISLPIISKGLANLAVEHSRPNLSVNLQILSSLAIDY